jgi:transcriptional regulator with XRE-family HTH domain
MVSLPQLRHIRERRALSQRELSALSGVSRMTIVRLEAGGEDPFPTTVRKLARALDVDPADLMEPAEAPSPKKAAA